MSAPPKDAFGEIMQGLNVKALQNLEYMESVKQVSCSS